MENPGSALTGGGRTSGSVARCHLTSRQSECLAQAHKMGQGYGMRGKRTKMHACTCKFALAGIMYVRVKKRRQQDYLAARRHIGVKSAVLRSASERSSQCYTFPTCHSVSCSCSCDYSAAYVVACFVPLFFVLCCAPKLFPRNRTFPAYRSTCCSRICKTIHCAGTWKTLATHATHVPPALPPPR